MSGETVRAVPPGITDLSGEIVGKLTVLGLAQRTAANRGNAHTIWIVRCACGTVETRTKKALRAGRESGGKGSMCANCRVQRSLEKRAAFRDRERRRVAAMTVDERFEYETRRHELTPAMIAAGAEEFGRVVPVDAAKPLLEPEVIVSRIFAAMRSAEPDP